MVVIQIIKIPAILHSLLLDLPEACDSTPDGHGTRRAKAVRAPSDDLLTALAFPDPHDGALHGVLPAEGAAVGGMLGYLDLTEELAEGCAVSGSILPGDANFSRAVLAHFAGLCVLNICLGGVRVRETERRAVAFFRTADGEGQLGG